MISLTWGLAATERASHVTTTSHVTLVPSRRGPQGKAPLDEAVWKCSTSSDVRSSHYDDWSQVQGLVSKAVIWNLLEPWGPHWHQHSGISYMRIFQKLNVFHLLNQGFPNFLGCDPQNSHFWRGDPTIIVSLHSIESRCEALWASKSAIFTTFSFFVK